jgi:TonB family protein
MPYMDLAMGTHLPRNLLGLVSRPQRIELSMLRLWPFILVGIPVLAAATVSSSYLAERNKTLQQRERRAWKALSRKSQYVDVPHLSTRSRCEEVQPPQALTTPSPLLTSWRERKIKVSFIIGTDGRVHSPLILESAGPTGDRRVLQTVRTWRYRPATCNGVPTETEGKVEFSSR